MGIPKDSAAGRRELEREMEGGCFVQRAGHQAGGSGQGLKRLLLELAELRSLAFDRDEVLM